MPSLSKSLSSSLTEQANSELFSSHLYLAMSCYCEKRGFSGMGNWLRLQSMEERGHAATIIDFISKRDGDMKLSQIAMPKDKWDSMLQMWQEVLEHEKEVTTRINKIITAARNEEDHGCAMFMEGLVHEQLEEESTATGILAKVAAYSNFEGLLYHLDRDLGKRKE